MKHGRLLFDLLLLIALAGGTVLHLQTRSELAQTRSALATLQADLATARTLVRVIDGDTIELDGGERVRILGIDTPELTERTAARGWRRLDNPAPAAIAARDWLRRWEGHPVQLSYDKKRKDPWNRTLAHVYLLPDGPDVAEEMLRRGWADLMAIPPNTTRYADWQDARSGHKTGIKPQSAPNATERHGTADVIGID